MFLKHWKINKLSENKNLLLTDDWTCDKVIKSLKQNDRYHHLKQFWKNLKKFLTNENRYDKLDKLSQDREHEHW